MRLRGLYAVVGRWYELKDKTGRGTKLERDSTKDFARAENGRENETDSVKTKADGTTFLFLFYNGT